MVIDPSPLYHFLKCPPTRIRTLDLLLKRELLYQLSYGRSRGTIIFVLKFYQDTFSQRRTLKSFHVSSPLFY